MEGYDLKTHYAEKDGSATLCGRKIAAVLVNRIDPDTPTCEVCLTSVPENFMPDVALTKGASS